MKKMSLTHATGGKAGSAVHTAASLYHQARALSCLEAAAARARMLATFSPTIRPQSPGGGALHVSPALPLALDAYAAPEVDPEVVVVALHNTLMMGTDGLGLPAPSAEPSPLATIPDVLCPPEWLSALDDALLLASLPSLPPSGSKAGLPQALSKHFPGVAGVPFDVNSSKAAAGARPCAPLSPHSADNFWGLPFEHAESTSPGKRDREVADVIPAALFGESPARALLLPPISTSLSMYDCEGRS